MVMWGGAVSVGGGLSVVNTEIIPGPFVGERGFGGRIVGLIRGEFQ